MSDESNRIGKRTGANANLVTILGDIVSSDGIQAIRVPLGTPGQVLSVDLTSESGLAWIDAGSGTVLTFSEGLTEDDDNVTNDLVTGNTVGQVAINIVGGDLVATVNGSHDIALTSGRRVDIDATTLLELTGTGIRIVSNPASQLILGSGANTLIDSGGSLLVSAGGSMQFTADVGSNGSFVITTDGAGDVMVTSARDESHSIGRNLSMNMAGAAGSTISADNSNLTLDAGAIGGTGEVRIMPSGGAPAATRTLRFWNGAGGGQQTVADPAGGGVIDAECRAQLIALLNALQLWGLLA